ncbi:hypothetical protein EZS27_010807 [termite gut metagenome]|uniref:Uncharacterized protein n=1 Tax=termite gut metagenome TaxID=433724 RepID=A0A5J4S7U7_9ZZZZ
MTCWLRLPVLKELIVFGGDEGNVLDRFIHAAESFQIDRFIRVCSNNPFLQINTFAMLFDTYTTSPADYIAYGFANRQPTIQTHLGLFSELTTTQALQRLLSKRKRIF